LATSYWISFHICLNQVSCFCWVCLLDLSC
jgi:uncharacterized membrane protein